MGAKDQGENGLTMPLLRGVTVLLGCLLLGPLASANDGAPPGIHALIQEGPDVLIVLRIYAEGGEPGVDEAYTVGREGEPPIVAEHVFDPAEAVDAEVGCRHYSDQELCLGAAPDDSLCIDCDEDGVPECSRHSFENWCERKLFFEVVDTCVQPGDTTYQFSADEWPFSQSESLLVVATGEVCEGAGCGCDASAGWTTPVTGALMIAIGIVGFRREMRVFG
jgi:hypothetical protein